METVITYYREGDYLILDLPRRRNRELAFGGEGEPVSAAAQGTHLYWNAVQWVAQCSS